MGKPERRVSVMGTGDFGCAITKRLIQNGYKVTVGSRNPMQRNLVRRDPVLAAAEVTTTRECILAANLIIVAIPHTKMDQLRAYGAELKGKVLVDVSNASKRVAKDEKSNAERLAELIPGTTVVKGFNTVSAYTMSSDTSNEHRQVYVASDSGAALETVIQLSRDLGFSAHNAGRLQKSRELEAEPLYLFRGWGWPTIFTAGLFIAELLYLFVVMYILVDRYDISQIPSYVLYKASGAVSVNLLAFCYLPGILAAFAQLYYGSKHVRFQKWLDSWLQGRKQLGIYSLMFAFIHMISVMSCMNGDYFDYLFKHQRVTVPIINATEDPVIEVDTKMNLHGEGCIASGLIALVTMSIIGLTSVPAIGATMNWREWRFIQSQFGFVCFLLTVGHCMVHGVSRWMVQRDLPYRNSFMSLILPWLTLLLKIIYFIPCVHIPVWRIRRGYERGVKYDTEMQLGEARTTSNKGTDNPLFGYDNEAFTGENKSQASDNNDSGMSNGSTSGDSSATDSIESTSETSSQTAETRSTENSEISQL